MIVFIDCVCDGDLKELCYEGHATEQQLKEAWTLILSEYYDAKGGIEDARWKLTIEIQRLQNHLFLVDRCVKFLTVRYSESVEHSLNGLGYRFKPIEKDPVKYESLLNSVVQKSKTKYIQLRQLMVQLETMIKNVKDEKPKREDFERVLIELEEMQKVTYSMDTLTVQKFLILEKKYLHQVELMQAKQK